jgi:glycosyltransferase involved in cell wall biosynthesis
VHGSVIIRSKDEADRLRLTLASLGQQTETAEIIVVNDGSSDHTRAVLAEAAERLPIIAIHHAVPLGRSAAANAGAALASGDVLLFLDGDMLAAPNFVAAHLALHRQAQPAAPGLIARGETYHLRGTRFFQDPAQGTPLPGQEDRIARLSQEELSRMRVARDDITENFANVESRSSPAIYPGAGPRLLYELEMDALRSAPGCDVLWVAASGSNQSVSRAAFRAVGGFDAALTINEHRELALRLCQNGLRMVPVAARTYHLTHRSGWRDPLLDNSWEAIFYRAHPLPAVALLSVLWSSLADRAPFPESSRIASLPALSEAAARCRGVYGIDEVRTAHFRATMTMDHAS